MCFTAKLLVLLSWLVAPTPALGINCFQDTWFEKDASDRWVPFEEGKVNAWILPHQPTMTHIPWTTLMKETNNWRTLTGLQRNLSFPVLNCTSHPYSCPAAVTINTGACLTLSNQVLCINVKGECKALILSVMEPRRCCRRHEKDNSNNLGRIVCVKVLNACPVHVNGSSALKELSKNLENRKLPIQVNAEHTKEYKKPILRPEVHLVEKYLGKESESSFLNKTENEGSELSDESSNEAKENTEITDLLEDVFAGFVFLFLASILFLIKRRVFEFTRKKTVQEDNDVESENTLIDETIV